MTILTLPFRQFQISSPTAVSHAYVWGGVVPRVADKDNRTWNLRRQQTPKYHLDDSSFMKYLSAYTWLENKIEFDYVYCI